MSFTRLRPLLPTSLLLKGADKTLDDLEANYDTILRIANFAPDFKPRALAFLDCLVSDC